MNLYDFDDSHDVYAKASWKGWLVKAGRIRFNHMNPFESWTDGSRETRSTSRKDWVELGWSDQLNEQFSLEWRVYHNWYDEPMQTQRDVDSYTHTNFAEAEGFGGEAILHFRSEDHHVLLGVSASDIDMSYHYKDEFADGTTFEADSIPPITDRNRAIFFEESYSGLEDWIFTFGLRVDRNKPRGNTTNILPRGSVFYSIDDHWSIKYAYNSGYVAPTLEQTRGGIYQPFPDVPEFIIKGATEIQESSSHDVQLFYKDGRSNASLTFFYHTLTDIIQWAGYGPVSVGGYDNVTLFETNTNDMTTYGLELAGETRPLNGLRVYGNYAYAHAEFEDRYVYFNGQQILDLQTGSNVYAGDGTVTGTPRHIWNLGLDWDIYHDLTMNLHYRGWTEAWAKKTTQPTFTKFGSEHYVDLNLNHKNILIDGLTASLYLKNMFDNTSAIPNGIEGGKVVPQNGRQIGLKVKLEF